MYVFPALCLELLLQVLIEPLNRQFDRFVARFAVNAVMRDIGNRNVFLGSRHPVISEFGVVLIVEEFFLFGNNEQGCAIFYFGGFVTRQVMNQFVADGRADQIADGLGAGFGIADFAARAASS
jgi:hypothetical protein